MSRIHGERVAPAVEAVRRLQRKGTGLWSWILMDESGREIERDIDKHSIMRRLKINGRDLRILSPLLSYPSTILAREKAILLNLEHIRAIITAKEVLVCNPSDDNVIPVVEQLRRQLHSIKGGEEDDLMLHEEIETGNLPFEFRALDVAMEAICSYLDARATELESTIFPALDLLTSTVLYFLSKISSRNLDRIRSLKSQLTKLTSRAQKVKDEIGKFLNDHNAMARLHLSRKSGETSPVTVSGGATASSLRGWSGSGSMEISGASKASIEAVCGDENYVGELEILLEDYLNQIDGTLNKLQQLHEYIDDTEGYINMQLDKLRNKLIKLDLFLSSGNLALSVHGMVCGILGMSIPYGWNHGYGYLFKWAVILTSALSGLIFLSIIAYARRKGLVVSGFF